MVDGLASKHPQVQRPVFAVVGRWLQIAIESFTAGDFQSNLVLRLKFGACSEPEPALDGLHDRPA